MKIETKFNFGQRVYRIYFSQDEYKEKCPVCEGNGSFVYKNKIIECSESGCWGEGFITKYKPKQWYLPKNENRSFVIQKISTQYFNPNNKKWDNYKNWTYYMDNSSGSMVDEKDCFATEKEALQECDKRNKKALLQSV